MEQKRQEGFRKNESAARYLTQILADVQDSLLSRSGKSLIGLMVKMVTA